MHAEHLITQAREGNDIAQGKLMQAWYKRIYNFGFKFFFDHDLAMEVAQKTFISMHRNIIHLQETSRFRSWLYTIAVNYCREELRKRKRERSTSLHSMDWRDGEVSLGWEASRERRESPERVLLQKELSGILEGCLMELSEEQREVVIMKEYEGMKFREIADVLNLSENTVKSRLYYGLEGMKKMLEKKNITKETIGYEL